MFLSIVKWILSYLACSRTEPEILSFSHVINFSLSTGSFSYKYAVTCPILKKKKTISWHYFLFSYWTFSLLPFMAKLLKLIIYTHACTHTHTLNLLNSFILNLLKLGFNSVSPQKLLSSRPSVDSIMLNVMAKFSICLYLTHPKQSDTTNYFSLMHIFSLVTHGTTSFGFLPTSWLVLLSLLCWYSSYDTPTS